MYFFQVALVSSGALLDFSAERDLNRAHIFSRIQLPRSVFFLVSGITPPGRTSACLCVCALVRIAECPGPWATCFSFPVESKNFLLCAPECLQVWRNRTTEQRVFNFPSVAVCSRSGVFLCLLNSRTCTNLSRATSLSRCSDAVCIRAEMYSGHWRAPDMSPLGVLRLFPTVFLFAFSSFATQDCSCLFVSRQRQSKRKEEGARCSRAVSAVQVDHHVTFYSSCSSNSLAFLVCCWSVSGLSVVWVAASLPLSSGRRGRKDIEVSMRCMVAS